jgi:hypothetical protein
VLVRVAEPDRLVELIVFLHNSGFPIAERREEGVAKLHSQDEARIEEAMRLWEARSGVRVEIVG